MENKTSTNHENSNDANKRLASAAIWWERLTQLKKELLKVNMGKLIQKK